MTSPAITTEFQGRFEHLRRSARRTALAAALATAALAAAALFALVAALDFHYELDRPVRIGLLSGSAALVLGWLAVRTISLWSRWSRPATAAELEHHFPQLGQRVRTAVEYGGRDEAALARSGVAASLVAALDDDAERRTAPLGLSSVVPTRRLLVTAALAIGAVALIVQSRELDPEWSCAVQRAALVEVPYTTVAVRPGDIAVDEGGSLSISAVVHGRPRPEVILLTRPVGDDGAAWSEQPLEVIASPGDQAKGETTAEKVDARAVTHSGQLAAVGEPLEYRVVAGPAASGTFRIGVRYPLSIESVSTVIEPPAYTGLPTKTVADGNIAALAGSRATVRIELDREPATASAVLRRVGKLDEGEERERTIPLRADGRTLTLPLELTADLRWSIHAESKDGTKLPENAFRARVHEDQPPRITFESPDEQLEVHTLAEILMRIRMADDYGLTQAGIVFQINNGEPYTLPAKDFAEAAQAAAGAAEELESSGRLAPPTRSSLERVLPLEHFALTQKDCVLYYAFAEDNFPGSPHRAETELRFIDIRPFKQIYRMREDGMGGMGGGGFVSLEELIRMERRVLNRTLTLERRTERWGDLELNSVERIKASQQRIADATRELSERLIERGADDVDSLARAEEAMLAAVDSLTVGKFDAAGLHEKDAQQYLVEARNALEILLRNADSATLRRALGQIDQALRQKLRRNRDEEQEQTTRSLIARLQALARSQNQTAGELAALSERMRGGNGSATMPDEDMPGEDMAEPDTTDEDMTEPDAAGPDEIADGQPTAAELEDRQFELVTEARELQTELEGTEGVTDLAKERMQAATEVADQAAGAVSRGATDEAAEQAGDAGERFNELARQVAALLAEEATDRVAMSRDMAANTAVTQRQLAGRLRQPDSEETDETEAEDTPANGPSSPSPKSPQETAAGLAERAKTLRDVLRALAMSDRPDDGEAADRVAELLGESDIERTLEQVEELPTTIGEMDAGQAEPQMIVEVEDAADRLEAAARELDRIYRALVTPRIEALRELEQQAATMEEQMNLLETTQDVAGWQRDFEDLLRELEEAGGGGGTREELSEMAQSGRLPTVAMWDRAADAGGVTRFRSPRLYQTQVPLLVEEIREQIQELVLTDLLADRDEPTPPEYDHLIEQYLKVLAAEEPR